MLPTHVLYVLTVPLYYCVVCCTKSGVCAVGYLVLATGNTGLSVQVYVCCYVSVCHANAV